MAQSEALLSQMACTDYKKQRVAVRGILFAPRVHLRDDNRNNSAAQDEHAAHQHYLEYWKASHACTEICASSDS